MDFLSIDRLIYLIGLGVVLLIGLPTAIILYARYWNNTKFIKAQLAKIPLDTFGGTFSKWKNYAFNEDEFRGLPQLEHPLFDKLLSTKGLLLLTLGLSFVLSLIPLLFGLNSFMGAWILLFLLFAPVPFVTAYRKSYGRYVEIEGARNAQIQRMYDIANTALKFDPTTAYMPQSVVNVTKWKDQTTPASIVILYPTTFRADTQTAREGFESIFNTAITEENAWIYTWHPTKNAIQCRPVEDLPTMVEYKGAGPFEWHTFPIGVGLGPKGQEIISYSVNKNKTGIYYPHLLLGGTTGSGKSVIQRNIIFHCIQHNDMWRFLGVDLKRVELSRFRRYTKTVLGIATDLEQGVEVCRYAHDVMMDRYAKMEEAGVNIFLDMVNEEGKPDYAIMLMIDEAFMFMSPEGNKTEEGKVRDAMHAEASQLIGDIARLGRAAGVHLVLATQRPDATVIKGELKNNLDVRIAAGRLDTIPSNMVLDSQAATMLPAIKGRGIIRLGGENRMFQGFFAEQEWIDQWLSKPQNRWREPDLFKDAKKPRPQEPENDPTRLSVPEPTLSQELEFDEINEFEPLETEAIPVPVPIPAPAQNFKPALSIDQSEEQEAPQIIESIPANIEVNATEDSTEDDDITDISFMYDDEIDEINDINISDEEIEALLAELASLDDDTETFDDEDEDNEVLEPINLDDEDEEVIVEQQTPEPVAVQPKVVAKPESKPQPPAVKTERNNEQPDSSQQHKQKPQSVTKKPAIPPRPSLKRPTLPSKEVKAEPKVEVPKPQETALKLPPKPASPPLPPRPNR